MVSGDALTIDTYTATFSDANAADGKTVTVTVTKLGGADAGNYSIGTSIQAYATGTTKATANIKPFVITGNSATGSGSAVTNPGNVIYTGASQALNPTVKVRLDSTGTQTTIVLDTDYELAYFNSEFGSNNTTGAGTITVTITGKGNYEGTKTATYTITKAIINNITWDSTTDDISYPYDGDAHAPVITSVTTTNNSSLASNAIPVKLGDMFDYSYSGASTDNKAAGEYEAVATLKGDYAKNFEFNATLKGDDTSSTKKAFKITMATITLVTAAAYIDTYDRKKHGAFTNIKATVVAGTTENNDNNLTYWYWNGTGSSITDWKNVADGDWTTTMPEFENAGTYTVFYKITADNHNTIGGSRSVTINKKNISGAYDASSGNLNGSILPSSLSSVPYTGNAYTEHADLWIKVMLSATEEYTLASSEYNLSFSDNIKAGTAKITITGDGKNYTGTRTINFTINKANITDITLTPYTGTYDGALHDVIKSGTIGETLVNGDDDDTNTATWLFRVDGSSNWETMPQLKDATTGTKIFYKITAPNHNEISGDTYFVTVVIDQKDIGGDYRLNSGLALADETYTGSPIEPTFKVEQNLNGDGTTWTELTNKDFDFSYSANHTDVGTVTVTVTGKGNYKGTNTITFNIVAANGITASAQGYQKTYDGIFHDAVYSQSGSALGGNTVQWWYSTEDISATDTGWSTQIPQVKDVGDTGTYYFKVTADNNAPFVGNVEVKITPKQITSVDGFAADGKVYDGSKNYVSGDDGSVKTDGTAASVHLDDVKESNLGGYIANIEERDDATGNINVIAGDLYIVWSDDAKDNDALKGEFDGVDKDTHSVTIPRASLALGGDEADNYELVLSEDIVIENVEIYARVVKIKWEGLSQNWDNNKVLKPTATITNLVGGVNVTPIIKITQGSTEVSPTMPGDYHVEITGLNGDTKGNYTIVGATDLSKTFSITTTSTVVFWNANGLVYDGTAKLPKIYYEVVEDGVRKQVDVTDGEDGQLEAGTSFVIKDESGKVVTEAINAGKYTVTLKLNVNHVWDGDLNGTQREKSIEFEIKKATLTGIELAPSTGNTYTGSEFTLSVNWANTKLNNEAYGKQPEGVTVTLFYDGVASNGVAKVGAHKVTAKFTVNGNFNTIDDIKDVELEIVKAEIRLTGIAFENDNKTVNYNGTAFKNEITGTLDDKISVTYTYEKDGVTYGADGVTAVGVYNVTANFAFKNAADKDNYKLLINGIEQTTLTATLTINKEAAAVGNIVFEDARETYDGNTHRLLVSNKPAGIKGVSYEYATDEQFKNVVSTDGVKNAGTYYVRATFTVDDNYASVDPMVKTLIIDKAALTVKVNDKTITYGDNPNTAAYTITVSGLVGGDTVASLGTPTFKVVGYTIYGNVGIYEGAITVSGLKSNNYDIDDTESAGDLTVKPREIQVNWYNDDTKSKQDLIYTYTGATFTPYADVINAVHGDTVKVTVEGGKIDAGMNYEAKATGVSNSNYALPVSGLTVNFEIIPSPKAGVIFWDYTTLYYNGQEQKPKAYFFENENDNSPKELTVTVNKKSVNAGDYVATAVLGGNYSLTGETTHNFTILKRVVHVVIGDYSIGYAGTIDLSGVTWTYADGSLEFVSGESYTITFSCPAVTAKGTYPISAQFNSANAANYTVEFSGSWSKAGDTENNGKCGTLTVTAAKYDMSKVTFTGTDVTYDGNPHVITVNGLPAGVTASMNYTLDGWALGDGGVVAAGTYKVIVSFTGSSYFEPIADMEVTLTVKKAALTVKANDVTITYGDALTTKGVTYMIDGVEYTLEQLAGQLNGTLTLKPEDGYNGNAAKYKLIPAGLTSDNYDISFVPGNLTVSPREITVTWYSDSTTSSTNLFYDYDNATHQPYPVASGMLGDDKVTFTVSGGTSAAGLNHTATITGISNSNYAVKKGQESVNFSIIQKGVVIWDNSTITYDKDKGNQKPKAYYYDEDAGDLAELNVAIKAPYADNHADAGIEYTAYVTNAPEGITASEYTYKIAPKPIELTIGVAENLVYGSVEGDENLKRVLADLLAAMGFEGDPSEIELICNVDNNSSVDTYTITGKYNGKNYQITFTAGSLTIVKTNVKDTDNVLSSFNGKTATVKYDGKVHTIEVEGNLPDGVTGVTYKYYNVTLGKYVDASEVVNAGTYRIEAYFTVDGNHNAVTGTYEATLTIQQATLDVKFDKNSYEFDYDGKLHTAKVTGDLTGVKSITYYYDGEELSGVKDAGSYQVTAVIEVEDDNYASITLDAVTLVINQVTLTVTANDASIVYGQTPNADGYGYSVDGLAPADAADLDAILGNLSYSYETITKVGVYKITVSGNTSSKNYKEIKYETGKLTVTPYTLTANNVQWLDKKDGAPATEGKFVYTYKAGTLNQPYAYTVNLINGESVTLVVEGGQINAGYGYEATIARIEGANAANYMLPAEGLKVTFDILPAPKTGTIIWDNAPLYYNGSNLKPAAYYFLEEGGERIPLTVTVDGESTNVGKKYTATVVTEGLGIELKGDKTKEFEVLARPVYVVIGNLEVQYGDTPNMGAVTWKYLYPDDATKQFLAGETFTITFNCGAVSGVGTYPISAQFVSDNSDNYNVVFSGNWASAGADNGKYGTLTVIKASYDMSKVSFVGTQVTYDGKNHAISVIGLPEGVTVDTVIYEKDGFSYGIAGVKNAGTYNVTVKFKGDENYGELDDMTTTLTIKKAALTIKANDKTITYGDSPAANGVTYTGFAKDESGNEINDLKGALSYTYGYVAGAGVGKYDIIPAGFTSENYEITYKVGTLTVAPRTITISWYDDETLGSQTFVYEYDEQNHAPYAVAGNLVAGDSLTLTVKGATDIPGFNFVATVEALTNPNYKLPNDESVNCTFSIAPAPARSIIWDNAPIYYNGENNKPKAYYIEEDGSWTEITEVRVYVGGVIQTEYKNAGLYTATVIYNGISSSQAYNILPVAITVVIGDTSVEYGKTLNLSNLEWSYGEGSKHFMDKDLLAGAPITFRCPTYTAESTVGKYEITGNCTSDNYKVTFVNGTLTVKKASYQDAIDKLVYGGLMATYDGADHTITISGLPEGVIATVSYEKDGKIYGNNGVREAGTYNVTISFVIPDTVNYETISEVTGITMTIQKAAASANGIIFNGTTKKTTYNGDVQEMFATLTGTTVGITGINYTYYEADGVTEVTGGAKDAGTYMVKAEFVIDSNYDGTGIAAQWATLIIEKAALTVTANDASVIYGETANANGYTVKGLVSGDDEYSILGTVTFTYGTYGNAGKYEGAIEIHGNETAGNYEITYVNGALTVTPREITITWYDAENGNKINDGDEIVYVYDGTTYFIPFAEAGNLAGTETLTLQVEVEQKDAGISYVATVQALTNGNYKLPVNVSINFTVKYSEADEKDHEYELVWNNDALYYNGDIQTPAARYYDPDDSKWHDVTDLTITDKSGKEVDAIGVGEYVAEYVDSTGTFKNTRFEFKIVPRNVYVVIGDMQIKFGETPDMGKVSWTYAFNDASKQFVSGDSYTLTFSVEEITAAKKYPITGNFAGNDNYNVVFINGSWVTSGADNGAYGTLTVNKATYDMSRVTFSGTDVTYDGEVHEITVNKNGLPAGVTVEKVTYARGGWTYNGVVNAGTYTVTVSFKGDDNHEAIDDITVTITVKKAALTVTANDSNIIYGESPADNGVTYQGLAVNDADENGQPKANVFGGSLTYEYNYLKRGSVGNYNVTPKGLISENYSITYVSGTLHVEKRTITVLWYNDERMNSQTLKYNVDGTSHLPYAEAGNLVPGDSVVLTVSGAQTAAGINYVATIVEISNPNYKLPEGGTTVFFEIVPDAYVIVWESMPFVFNGENQAPKAYYYTNNGERVPLLVTVKEGASVNADTYHAVASLISGNVTLTGEFEHEFTIAKREVTIKIKDCGSAYGEDINLADWWQYAEGSLQFVAGAPIYPVLSASKTSSVGKYVISGDCTDSDNYIVKFIDGTYTIEKAVIYAPTISSKEYTGEILSADIVDTNRYRVIYSQSGINVGTYTVILLLKDFTNCRWADTNSEEYRLEFVITMAENEWTTEFEVRGTVVAGSGIMFITEPEAKFGHSDDIVIKYYRDENCTREVTEDFIKNEAAQGTYYAKVTLAGTDNYSALESVYSFTVSGTLTVQIFWSNTTLTYNGLAQAPEAYVWIAGEQVFLKVTGAQIDAGPHTATTNLKPVDEDIDLDGYEFTGLDTVEFVINARRITVQIDDDASSVYGSAVTDLTRLNWHVTQGSIMANDELGIYFTSEVQDVQFADAGVYAIIGNWTNDNYKVSFVGSWKSEDDLNGAAATYTVIKATITVTKSESTWFDEDGVIDRYKNYFVYLDAKDEDDNYKYITLQCGQSATVYYSLNIDKYNANVHDNMTESQIKDMLNGGVSTSAPEIKQAGNWVIYYRVEAENHEVKYGIWKVLIQPKDRYIMVTFNKPYTAMYGESLVDENGNPVDILDKLIAGGYITVDGAVIDLNELSSIAYAYAYEDVSDNGYVNESTGAGKYSIRLVFKDWASENEAYSNLEFRYSTTNEPNSDTNYDKYVVNARPITFNWKDTSFTYDGELHLPTAKITGLVNGEEYELSGLHLGVNTITLANNDTINVTLKLVSDGDGSSVGSYNLRISIDNENYAIANNSDLVTVKIAQRGIKVDWKETSFKYDGEKHLPEATVIIGGESFAIGQFTLGLPTRITLANGDIINVVISMVGNSDMTTEGYTLNVVIDNPNYKMEDGSVSVDIDITGYKAPVKFTLPVWAIIAIVAVVILMIFIIVILIAKRRKQPEYVEEGIAGDDDGFSDPYNEE